MNILIFGARGKVGRELVDRLSARHDHVEALTRADADLRNPINASRWIHAQKPDVVINATAMNGVENVNKAPQFGLLVNGAAPGIMAAECAEIGALFIHYSTDYVFFNGGEALHETKYAEPSSAYGWSKLVGEQSTLLCGDCSLVFRLSNIYGREWAGPLHPIKQAKDGAGTSRENPLKIIKQFCAPTSARIVAEATAHVVETLPRDEWRGAKGIYHLATTEGVWRETFIRYALDRAFGRQPTDWECAEAVLPLPRPTHSFLVSDKFQKRFGFKLPTWREDLEQTLPIMERLAA